MTFRKTITLATLMLAAPLSSSAVTPLTPYEPTRQSMTANQYHEIRVETGADLSSALPIKGVPKKALLALTWVAQPIHITGTLVTETILGTNGKPTTVISLDVETIALLGNAPVQGVLAWEEGLLLRDPYGLWLRRAHGDPLRLGGPLTTFLERIANRRKLVKTRGFRHSGTFHVIEIDFEGAR